MTKSEIARPIKVRQLPGAPVIIDASEAEREALARRFGITSIEELHAEITLDKESKAIVATGRLSAQITQNCAISGEDFGVAIDEPLMFRFVEEGSLAAPVEEDDEIEIELSPDDCDEIEYSGDSFDLGEAVAQSLGLAIDPYAEGPGADEARRKAGITSDEEQAPSGPLAEALAALKKD